MYSHLMLAPSKEDDGLLTVGEIFGLRMNASLVVLSACVTGLGSLNNGDEIIGLSRAFLYAGSKDVIVSLWNVADEATVFLMTQFYKNMAGSNPVQSLRHAQIATRQKYNNPVHWAPFQLIGTGF
jgi:CHAT domain-containing protein